MADYPSDEEILEEYFENMNGIKDINAYRSDYMNLKKNTTANFLLVFFLGGLGFHKFYLNKAGWGLGLIAGSILSIVFYVQGLEAPYIIFRLVIAVIVLFDLFTYKAAVFHHNEELACDLAQKYLQARPAESNNIFVE